MLELREAKTAKEKKNFFDFANNLYKDNDNYVPYLISDSKNMFNEKKNPAFEFSEVKLFYVKKDGKIAGTIGGIINHKANEKWNQQRVRMTYLDFIDDMQVSRMLLEAVMNWGREKGMTEICGPLGFTDLDREGMLVDGFDEPGMLITYYNAPYYLKHMQALGFDFDAQWVESRHQRIYMEN